MRGLPWRPLLAAAGTTTHVIDAERGAVVEHLERWKSKPGEVRWILRMLCVGAVCGRCAWALWLRALSWAPLPPCRAL